MSENEAEFLALQLEDTTDVSPWEIHLKKWLPYTPWYDRLPNPEIPRATIDKLLRAFENATQNELLKVRWQEIQRFKLSFVSDQ